MKNLIFSFFLVMGSVGCATSYPKIDLAKENFSARPTNVLIPVPFTEQTPEMCGPTALYMVAKRVDASANLDDIKKLTFTPKAQGAYNQDMLSAARREHLQPYTVHTMDAIFDRLAYGYPVIIFHRTGFLWRDLWHYSVLTGYDVPNAEFIMHIGPYENKHADVSKVIGSWKEGGDWAMFVENTQSLPPGIDFKEGLDNALAFLRLGYIEDAYLVASQMKSRFPDRYEVDVVLAETLLKKNMKKEALAELKVGSEKEPGNQALKDKIAEMTE